MTLFSVQDPVMQMIVVAGHDSHIPVGRIGKFTHNTPPDRQKHVKNGNPDGKDRQLQGYKSHRCRNLCHADIGKEKTDEHAAGIPQKDLCRVEVVPQKAQTGRTKNQEHGCKQHIRLRHDDDPASKALR